MRVTKGKQETQKEDPSKEGERICPQARRAMVCSFGSLWRNLFADYGALSRRRAQGGGGELCSGSVRFEGGLKSHGKAWGITCWWCHIWRAEGRD